MQHINGKIDYKVLSASCAPPVCSMKFSCSACHAFLALRWWMWMRRTLLAACQKLIWHHQSISRIEASDAFRLGLHMFIVCADCEGIPTTGRLKNSAFFIYIWMSVQRGKLSKHAMLWCSCKTELTNSSVLITKLKKKPKHLPCC